MPLVEIELPRHRHREVTIGHFGDQKVAICAAVAQVRKFIFAAARAANPCLDFAGVAEPHAALSQQVEPDVGEPDVLFDHRSMADPFA